MEWAWGIVGLLLGLLAGGALAWRARAGAREWAELGSRFEVDEAVVAAPSSTDFRSSRNITIVFPTEAVLSRLELLFRYGMNRAWMTGEGSRGPGNGDFEI